MRCCFRRSHWRRRRRLQLKGSTARRTSATATPPAQSLSLNNLQFDVDVDVPGTVLSFTGHFTDSGVHVGPTGGYQVGPITVFGRHLYLVSADYAAAAAIGNKTGGGIEVPLPLGAVLRLSIHNHQNGGDGPDELTVGVGARF